MALVNQSLKTQLKLPEGTQLFRQTYEKEPYPDGVILIKLSRFQDDWGGSFGEATRINQGQLSLLAGTNINFSLAQINISNLASGEIRFWHVHPDTVERQGQNEIWMINHGTLLVGLIDYRADSKTYGKKTKIVLTNDKALYIPKGILHGFCNPTPETTTLLYFTDQQFDPGDLTQEMRVSPEQIPYDWVLSEKL